MHPTGKRAEPIHNNMLFTNNIMASYRQSIKIIELSQPEIKKRREKCRHMAYYAIKLL